MLDVGWSEILIIAVVALVVVGPKELPQLLRTAGQWAARARRMAGEFQSQMNQAIREAELDDVRQSVADLKSLSPKALLAEQLGSVTETLSQIERDTNAELAKIEAGVAPATPSETGEPMALAPEAPSIEPAVIEPATVEAAQVPPPSFEPSVAEPAPVTVAQDVKPEEAPRG